MRPKRHTALLAVTFATLAVFAALPAAAQTAAAPAPAPAPAAPAANPVVAKVGSQELRLSDVTEAEQSLPDQYRGMPPATLFPLVRDQLADRLALVALARKQGLDNDPEVKRAMAFAADQTLQNALLQRNIGPQLTEPAIRARYDRDIAGKTGEEEVHARHILVPTEAEAKQIIADLKKGADFQTLAKSRSKDPGAAQGGDLGFFKKADMLPPFSAAAFAMKPGQISDKPVQTQYGWHVIQVVERRAAPPPTFEEAHDQLRDAMVRDAIQAKLAEARAANPIQTFNADGTTPRATDAAVPPPAKP